MGQKISPVAYRLGIKNYWLTIGKYENNIRLLIEGIFKAFNYLISEIIIKKSANRYKINIVIYNLGGKRSRLIYLQTLITKIIEKKYRIKLDWIIRETLKFDNAKIIGDWLAIKISEQPIRIKAIVNKANSVLKYE